jgi:hypothetical protein
VLPLAVKDRELGELLADVESAYRRTLQQIRFAMVLSYLMPSRRTGVCALVNSALLGLRRPDAASRLLPLMERLSERLELA